jgi:hypothetical protein
MGGKIMSKLNKHVYAGLSVCAALWCVSIPARAQLRFDVTAHPDQFAHPETFKFDGGPLGELESSAAVDGYFFWQSGAADGSTVGSRSTGAEVGAFEVELSKKTGPNDLFGFFIQAAEYQPINLGLNKPKDVNANRYQTGPIRTAYVSVQPYQDLIVSVGQVMSIEGYESVFPWNNPVALRTAANPPQNSNSKGIQLDYDHGPFSGTIIFGDGYDTNDFNYFQLSGTYKFDPGNQLTVYAGVPVGVTGPDAFAYGGGGTTPGGGNGVGGQQQLAVVNSNTIGAWYTWRSGGLQIIPELQYQYTPRLTNFANRTSGGNSDDIPKETSAFVAALFAMYRIPDTHFSISGWVDYGASQGTAAQDVWFAAPNQKLAGVAIAPAYKYNRIFVRLDMGYNHLTNLGTPASGYGSNGTRRNQAIGLTEFGLVF